MKKMNFLKLVTGIAVAMFVTSGLFAQPYPPAPYDTIRGGVAATEIDSVSIGTTSGYYVLPDEYFHPNYSSAGTLTGGFVWNWTINPAGPVLSAAQTATNYVTINYAGGTVNQLYEVTVNEQSPVVPYGGCTGPDTNMWVRVIDTPRVAFTAGAGFLSANVEACEGAAAIDNEIIQAAFTGINSFQLQWRLQIHTLQADHSTIDAYWEDNKITEILVAPFFAIDSNGTAGTQETNLTAATLSLSTAGYLTCVVDAGLKRATVYTYTLRGVNDRISRKSDYLSNTTAAKTGWSWYDDGAKTVVIIVNPTPVTGPIFHIPNDWNN